MGNKPKDAGGYFSSLYGLQKRFLNPELIELNRKENQAFGNEPWDEKPRQYRC